MKTSNITKSALALALGLCASGAWAATVTPVSEDFEGAAFDNGINGVTTNNLTWADTEGYSAVSGGKLVVDAADTPTSATIDPSVTNGINSAFGARNAKFNATVTFVPATEDPVVTGADLKFALYAKAVTGATNLYVIANGGAQPTGISLANVVDQNVEVAFTAADTFTVKVGASTSSAFTFANSGDISKVEFSGNGEVEQLGFSYDLVDTTITWPTTLSVVSYTVDGVAGDALTASAGTYTVSTEPGAAIVITGTTPYGATVTANGSAGTGFGITTATTDLGWYFPCTATAGQDGTAANPFEIDSVNALVALKDAVANVAAARSKSYVQTANIALTAAWEGIGVKGGKDIVSQAAYDDGAFTGVYDGGNYTISNFLMENGTDYGALFNSIYNATIKNLKLSWGSSKLCANSSASGGDTGASFVGVAKASTLQNLTTVAGAVTTVSASKDFGGIVGYLMAGSTVESCTNALNVASLKGGRKCGGIAIITQGGTGTAVLRNCKNSGTSAGGAQDGGIVGYIGVATEIDGCENTAAVQLFKFQSGSVTASGVNKGNATVRSSDASVAGLRFATVDGDVATFVADDALALNGSYKVMATGATATFAFAEAGTIAFDTALFTPTYAITAPGLVLSDSTSGTVTTYTARNYAVVNVTVTGGANATAAWTVDGASAAAPSTLTEGQTYSVTYTANEGYKFADGATTSASGTAGTEAISITIADAIADSPSYTATQELKIGGESGTTHELSATEAAYLNSIADGKTPEEMNTILANVDEETFEDAALLNQDIANPTTAGSYEFKVSSLKKKAGGKVEVKVTLTRSGSVLGKIKGTVVLKTCATPNGNYAEVASENIEANFGEGSAAATQEFTATFTGVTDKFFKAEIK